MLKDTPRRYGQITRVLHWTMVLLFLWQFGGMIMKDILGRGPVTAFWVGSHASVGVLLLALALLRGAWALGQRGTRPPHARNLLGRLAAAGHMAMYLLMLIVPLLATVRMFGSDKPIRLFGMLVRGPSQKVEWMIAPANLLHSTFAWALLAMIAGHIAMVIVHQYIWKDATLSRMLR